MTKIPRYPIPERAKKHLEKLLREQKIGNDKERKKTIKRCEMHDRGFTQKKEDKWKAEKDRY